MREAARSRSPPRTPLRRGTTPSRFHHGRGTRANKMVFEDEGARCLGCGARYDGYAQCTCDPQAVASPLAPAAAPEDVEDLGPVAERLRRSTVAAQTGQSPLGRSRRDFARVVEGGRRWAGWAEAADAAHPAVRLAVRTTPLGRHATDAEAAAEPPRPPPRAVDAMAALLGSSLERASQTQEWSPSPGP